MRIKLIIALLVFVFGQKVGAQQSPNVRSAMNNFICSAADYKFILNGQEVMDKKKAFVCPNSLPETVQVIDAEGNPILFSTTWTGATNVPGDPSKGTFNSNDFIKGKNEIECSFIANATPITISLTVLTKVKTQFKEAAGDSYAFDKNKIGGYPHFNIPSPETPYKFLESGNSDPVKVTTSPSKAFYAPKMITSDPTWLSILPNTLSSGNENLLAVSSGILPDLTRDIDINGCLSSPELRIVMGNRIEKTIDIIYMCDSSGNCAPQINEQILVDEANAVLNQVGVYLTINSIQIDTPLIPLGNVLIEYNHLGGGPNSGDFTVNDQRRVSNYYDAIPNSPWQADYLVLMVPELQQSGDPASQVTLGRALPAIGINPFVHATNSIAMDVGGLLPHGRNLAHEIGHACFMFWHPDSSNAQAPFTVVDSENFMHSLYSQLSGKIRGYQMTQIHSIR